MRFFAYLHFAVNPIRIGHIVSEIWSIEGLQAKFANVEVLGVINSKAHLNLNNTLEIHCQIWVSRQSSKVRGVVTTSKYFKSPFWKISAWYGARTFRTCYKHRFPSLYAKNRVKFRYLELFLAKKLIFCQFWSMFTENPLFETGHVWKRHCDVIRWPIFMILVSMERGDPTLYHGTKQTYFGLVNFKFIRGGVVTTPPLGKPCYKKKGLVGRGLNVTFWKDTEAIPWKMVGLEL